MTPQTLVLGTDHAGFRLKAQLKAFIEAQGILVYDVGCFDEASVDYPAVARQVVDAMQAKAVARGVMICGSGVGVSIAANRYAHIRAVLAHEPHIAALSRQHNDSNVLCLGGRIVAPELAEEIFSVWWQTPFEGERHQRRVTQLAELT